MAEILLYRATGPTDAYLLRRFLAARGIPCRLRGESLLGLGGAIPMPDAWPTVWVPAAHEAPARAALRAWTGPTLAHPAWRCPGCGEENPAGFFVCWSCETERP